MPYMPAAMHTPDSQCSSANTAAAASRKKARTAGGYSSDCAPRAYACHIAELTAELLHAPLVQGYCCTQPCEGQNGLLASDRTPKVPLELIWKANEGRGAGAAAMLLVLYAKGISRLSEMYSGGLFFIAAP